MVSEGVEFLVELPVDTAMNKKRTDDQFSEQEAQRRFHEALRGARVAGHKAMNEIPKKNGESRRLKRKSKHTGSHAE